MLEIADNEENMKWDFFLFIPPHTLGWGGGDKKSEQGNSGDIGEWRFPLPYLLSGETTFHLTPC